jgi:hypothetical protein
MTNQIESELLKMLESSDVEVRFEQEGAQPPSVREGSSDLGSHRVRGRLDGLFGDF